MKVTRPNAGLTEPIRTIEPCGGGRRVRKAPNAPIDHSLNDGSRHWRAMESSPCLRLGQSERLLTCTTLHRAFPVPRDRLAPSTALSQYPTRHQCPPPDRRVRPAGKCVGKVNFGEQGDQATRNKRVAPETSVMHPRRFPEDMRGEMMVKEEMLRGGRCSLARIRGRSWW